MRDVTGFNRMPEWLERVRIVAVTLHDPAELLLTFEADPADLEGQYFRLIEQIDIGGYVDTPSQGGDVWGPRSWPVRYDNDFVITGRRAFATYTITEKAAWPEAFCEFTSLIDVTVTYLDITTGQPRIHHQE